MKITVYVNGGKCAEGWMENDNMDSSGIWNLTLIHGEVRHAIGERQVTSRSVGFQENDEREMECRVHINTEKRDRIRWKS